MKTVFYKIFRKTPFIILVAGFLFLNLGCKKDSGPGFVADFSFEFKDKNHVTFNNLSEGEYYSLFWDFGNGDTVSTTDKTRKFEIWYPLKGNYNVTLKLFNYTGQQQSVTKPVSIAEDDLVVSFTATADPGNPNYVLLKNTSTGTYDSFKWVYREREKANTDNFRAWFPFTGQYVVQLVVTKGTTSLTAEKALTITSDDPNYADGLTLVWQDNFDGQNVNSEAWNFETGATGWGNNELQNYTNGANASLVNGNLVLTARKVNENKQAGSYTSTRINTMGKKEFRYGRLEIRAKLPSGTGIWPAIWMLGSNFKTAGWPACGEIDIMEYVGYQPNTVHATIHTPAGYGGSGTGTSIALPTCEEEFHNYGIIWTEKYIKFYIGTPGNITYTYQPSVKNSNNWPFNQPFFFILNVAVGGNWGGANGIDNAIFPQSMEVDYVKVYQEAQ
jgi:beta-glucanase (GH16 family)